MQDQKEHNLSDEELLGRFQKSRSPELFSLIYRKYFSSLVKYLSWLSGDKNLAKEERKKLQVINAPKKSPGAKQIKIADKTCNLRSILEDPPAGWSVTRRVEYFTWAAEVVAGLEGVNPRLDLEVKEVIQDGLAKLRAAEQSGER